MHARPPHNEAQKGAHATDAAAQRDRPAMADSPKDQSEHREETTPTEVPEPGHPSHWIAVDALWQERGHHDVQIGSFDSFLETDVRRIINQKRVLRERLPDMLPSEIEGGCCPEADFEWLGEPCIERPTVVVDDIKRVMFPDDAISQKQTYAGAMSMRGRVVWWPNDPAKRWVQEVDEPFFLGRMPIMVRSQWCNTRINAKREDSASQGGVFIIKGQQKTTVIQERQATNVMAVFRDPWKCEVRSHNEEGSRPPYMISIDFKPPPKKSPGADSGLDVIRANIPYIQKSAKGIPVVILFRALGVTSDRAVVEFVGDPTDARLRTALASSFEEASDVRTQEAAMRYIEQHAMIGIKGHTGRRIETVKDILIEELFPHIVSMNAESKIVEKNSAASAAANPETTKEEEEGQLEGAATAVGVYAYDAHDTDLAQKKANYLGMMICRMLMTMWGERAVDDKDHYSNKRLALPGPMLAMLFDVTWIRICADVAKYLRTCMKTGKEFVPANAVRAATLSKSIKYALTRGDWSMARGMPGGGGTRVSLSQVLQAGTPSAAAALLRRVNTPIGRAGKRPEPRELHKTHFGLYCLPETPEGDACLEVTTPVLMADGSLREIGKLRDGDSVMTVDPGSPWSDEVGETLRYVPSRIRKHFVREGQRAVRVVTETGRAVVATADHPFLVRMSLGIGPWETEFGPLALRFVEAGDLRKYVQASEIHDVRVVTEGGMERVASAEDEPEPVDVADFTTEHDNHTMVSGGFVTHNCGLVKNLAMTTHVSNRSDPEAVMILLRAFGMRPQRLSFDDHAVMVNGSAEGYSGDPFGLTSRLREFRRAGNLAPDVSIANIHGEREIRIWTSEGRGCRPLLVLRDRKFVFSGHHASMIQRYGHVMSPWSYLLSTGCVEYLDTDEMSSGRNVRIAFFAKDLEEQPDVHFTHCEIHPSVILGMCASSIPFPDHNQAPRNTYQSAMGKQAMGIQSSNYRHVFSSVQQILHYPQRPIAMTQMARRTDAFRLPTGFMAVVAVMPYDGHGQEDAIIMTQGFIDRGGGRTSVFRTYSDDEARQGSVPIDRFERPNPDKVSGVKDADYEGLDLDGIARVGYRVCPDSVLIGKTTPSVPKKAAELAAGNYVRKDNSTMMRKHDRGNAFGVVDSVMLTGTDRRTAAVKVRTERVPQVGDKFSSMHGQKGVIGWVLPDEDAPFGMHTGVRPDIIMNNHGFPSRMTMGQQHEMYRCKLAAAMGIEVVDATPFERDDDGLDPHDPSTAAIRAMTDLGCTPMGHEIMINGITGRMMSKKPIFMGVCYFQRLKHMVDDKSHARNDGHVQITTRQPLEGRGRGGGLKMGEMEADLMVTHGTAQVQYSRWFSQTDAFTVHICDICGRFASAIPDPVPKRVRRADGPVHGTHGLHRCVPCRNTVSISQVEMNFSAKVVTQEMMALGIDPRIITEDI